MKKRLLLILIILMVGSSLFAKGLKNVRTSKMEHNKSYLCGLFLVETKYSKCSIYLMDVNSGDDYIISFYQKDTLACFEIPEGDYIVTTIVGGSGNSIGYLKPPKVMLPTLKIRKGELFFFGEFRFRLKKGAYIPTIELSQELENDSRMMKMVEKQGLGDFKILNWMLNYPVVEGSFSFGGV